MSEEQRHFARLETGVTCEVVTALLGFEAQVRDLSLSGAGLLGTAGAEQGESITLMFEHQDGLISFAVTAEIVRVVPEGDQAFYGVHFEALPPDVRSQLVMLLHFISAGRGAKRRDAPRVARRVVVKCGSHDSFRAVLNDLSRGGFSVRCTRELKLGELLHARFGVAGLPELLEVQGPVVNVTDLGDGHFRVGAQFEALPEGHLQRIQALIEVLLGIGPRYAAVVDASP